MWGLTLINMIPFGASPWGSMIYMFGWHYSVYYKWVEYQWWKRETTTSKGIYLSGSPVTNAQPKTQSFLKPNYRTTPDKYTGKEKTSHCRVPKRHGIFWTGFPKTENNLNPCGLHKMRNVAPELDLRLKWAIYYLERSDNKSTKPAFLTYLLCDLGPITVLLPASCSSSVK